MLRFVAGPLRTARAHGMRLVTLMVALAAGLGTAMLVGLPSSQATTPAQRITGGQTLVAGQELESVGGQYALKLASNGNLQELISTGQVIWSTTDGVPGDHALLQPNGDLVLVDPSGDTLWSSDSHGTGCPTLDLQRDGNLVIYDTAAVWNKGAIHGLTDGQYLYPGWVEWSSGGDYYLVMQTDGNLVLYNDAGKALWDSKTQGNSGAYATLQTDGNFVVYSSAKKPLWASNTPGNAGDSLVVQADGNTVIYSKAGKALWNSETNGAANNGKDVDPQGPAASAKPCPAPPPQPVTVTTTETAPPVTVTTTDTTVETVPVPAPRPRHLRVKVTVKWSWSGAVTRLDRITVGRLPHAASFEATYEPPGRPHERPGRRAASERRRAASSRRRLRAVVGWLRHTIYRPGGRLFLKITRRHYVPERATFTIRDGRLPKLSAR